MNRGAMAVVWNPPATGAWQFTGGCGSIEFGGVGSLLLAACARAQRTGGLRRRHGAAVPIGTKKMFE